MSETTIITLIGFLTLLATNIFQIIKANQQHRYAQEEREANARLSKEQREQLAVKLEENTAISSQTLEEVQKVTGDSSETLKKS